ncbi:response regulator [uncultured Winogradskyella sp.]|uniref:response regulator n=1 Tax=uncultured Winogradskyella sp. TaxID=395353 RepID=UPI00262C363D|nr:response regulator [uncultured Winogradskyella sp.]
MVKKYNVLIVEDEPLIVGVLLNVLERISDLNPLIEFKVKSVANADEAKYEIDKAVNSTPIDFVLLDINIPHSNDKVILSGEDLGVMIKGFFPCVKIMVLTNHSDNFRLNNILKSLNPEGFIIKTDIDFDSLVSAIDCVLDDSPFYSKKVLQLMRKQFVNDFSLDTIDRQLLYHISKGAKTKDLIKMVSLSKSAIESRKRNLKSLFGIETGDDRKLILKAEKHGFI